MYFVYLLRCADNSLYCGITNNLEKRLRMHNGEIKGGAKYTRGRRPVSLETYATVVSLEKALQLEHSTKKQHVHKKISFINNYKAQLL